MNERRRARLIQVSLSQFEQSGLPGAGKDTWLARQRPGLPVVALDAIRDALDVDATDNQGEVIRWIELFTDYTARIEIVYLEPPIATILAQNKRRTDPVPETVILRLLEKLEPPTLTECHILTLV